MTSCAALSFRSEAHGCADSVATRSSYLRALAKASPHMEGHGDLLSRLVWDNWGYYMVSRGY